MSAAPGAGSGDAARSGPDPRPDHRTGGRLVGSLRVVVEGEARRALSDARIAADPERLAQGWERRFIADEARIAELVGLYQELGYETVVDPVHAADVDEACGDCRLVAARRLRMIYTRLGGRIARRLRRREVAR